MLGFNDSSAKQLTGKPLGSPPALAEETYRVVRPSYRVSDDAHGEVRHSTMQYIEEWIQDDGSAKWYLVTREWRTFYPWTHLGSTKQYMMSRGQRISAVKGPFTSLDDAETAWRAN